MTRRCILLLASLSVSAQTVPFFLQGSDPQMGMHAKDANFVQEQANLAFFIATANRLRPAFVILCGDLVNKAGDAAQIKAYQDLLKQFDPAIPVYNVAGNHDVGNEPTPASLAAYRQKFGKDYYTFQSGPLRGIVLNSSLIAAPQRVPEEAAAQERWLAAELARAKQDRVQHVVIFQHHPYFLREAGEADEYFNIPAATRQRYLKLFHEYGVHTIFAGHYHRNAGGRDGDLEMITTGPIGMPLGEAKSGFRVVFVQPGGLTHRYYEFGALPNTLAAP